MAGDPGESVPGASGRVFGFTLLDREADERIERLREAVWILTMDMRQRGVISAQHSSRVRELLEVGRGADCHVFGREPPPLREVQYP